MAENEALRLGSAISIPCMARTLALLLVALLGPEQCSGAATSDSELHRLRGRHRGHRRHLRAPPSVQVSSEDESSEAPLYDDFLDIMNNAASKALSEQRAIPAYDDFLHFMKHSAEKAYKQQAEPSYDEFLGFLKGKTDEVRAQSDPTPSYDDFLTALKASSEEALKDPVPTYEQFLNSLKDAAEMAFAKRTHSDEPVDTVQSLKVDERDTIDALKVDESENPLDRVKRGMKRVKNQMQGKKQDDAEDEDETSKLQNELRRLKEEKKRHEATGQPHAKKPLMKRINVLRTQLCWKRPNLWQHEKCLRFLGLHCMEQSTGEGICKAFTKKAGQKCKTSEDPRWKEDYCALSEALSDEYGDEDEEHDENEEAIEGDDDEDEIIDDEDEDVIASDDDLDHEDDAFDEEHGAGPPKIQARKAAGGPDRDGDGVPDAEDAFPDNAKEWKDTDKDGIGDNADQDLDGDGHANEVDAFPSDPKEWLDTDNDGIGDNADKDSDNDGVENDKDKFPDDPTEWLDSDGDGVGDNKDAYPFNPNCHDPVLPCLDQKGAKEPKPKSPQDPTTLDKDAMRALPPQGYNEHMTGAPVHHRNYYTWVSDWQNEFPDMKFSEKLTMAKICEDHPDNTWCEKFVNRDAHYR